MRKKWIAVLAAAVVLMAGCSSKETDKKEVTEHKEKEVEVEENASPEELPYQFPLTGLGTDEESSDRAVAVVVNNHPKARPQSGLHKADIVHEVLAEGDVTRFVAIFQSEQPEKIGPVRSAREYFIDLASGFDSFFIAHGYSPEAKEMLERGVLDNINGMQYDGTLFKRADFRKAPHNSYITYKNIVKGAEKKGYGLDEAPSPAVFLSSEEAGQLDGTPAEELMVKYGSPSFDAIYEYDAENEKYHRFNGSEETVDLESKEPVLLDNILVVQMNHQVIDNAGLREIDMATGGKGYLFQKGKVNEIQWKNEAGRIVPYKDGVKAGFVPGKTWINIVPSISDVSFDSQQ
ncbi:DUF3048 domain-containing protein [Mesobacillus boroniphilus]|uniref:DUF3048 domain-containing protein n=1 Tax=Mesobacillus boroniphilus TaxID=308892 RepID=A0A944CN37_9BACI|nr:DUF3048 domain-containing protein [Mesobacillus boroniphilus]MBS8266218.1 DUF3048 domain-containing protein [Mesobacillus boroniphilus]